MKTYIGVKIVQAEPEVKDGVQGYRVVYSEPDKPDYVSWCPADVFERHNRETSGMPFSKALEAVKLGKKIARKSWKGGGQFLYYQKGSVIDPKDGINDVLRTMEGPIVIRPRLDLKSADGSIQIGWLASQPDILSDDWFVVED
jgi:hypothetical protein